jgi:FG-GAP-like repeat
MLGGSPAPRRATAGDWRALGRIRQQPLEAFGRIAEFSMRASSSVAKSPRASGFVSFSVTLRRGTGRQAMSLSFRPVARVLGAILVAGLAGGGSALAATQAPTFIRADYPFLGNTHIAADFNGDGRADLAGTGLQFASVRLNNGAGSFGARVDYPVGGPGQDLASGDFNRDGRLDLVVTIHDPNTGLSLLTGNGNGTFSAPVNLPNTSGFDSPAVAPVDLNNDGNLDLAIAHSIACFTAPCRVTETMSVMLGNGDGTFSPSHEIQVGRGMTEIAVGDYNRDGRRDLAIAGDNARVYRLQGNGDGTFTQQPTLTLINDGTPNIGVDGTDIDVADFNGDAIQDLVVALGLNGSRTAILIGNGDGSFRPPLIITDPNVNIPHQQAVADYNGDGFQDLALSQADGNTGLMLMRNGNGNGTFQPPVVYLRPPPTSVGGYTIVAAHLNGDNKPDIALGRSGAFPALLVLLNSTVVAPPAPPAPPAAPALISPTQDARPTQPVAFDWSDVSAAASYRIQIDDSSSFSTPLVLDRTVTVSQFTASTLAARQHWWRVRGINSAGTAGAWSSVRRFTPRATATTPAPAPAPASSLSAVSVTPTSVTGGAPSQGRVTLTSAAPAGGLAVSLSSSSAAVTVPASVSVAQGATSATFPISTSAVLLSTPAAITATAGGLTRTATLTVTPPGQSATLTVRATGRSGERVTSSPAGINVAVGSTGSAPFSTGSAITLTVSNGREAVWSGACSSGGDERRSCAFTLGGNASVTADVD